MNWRDKVEFGVLTANDQLRLNVYTIATLPTDVVAGTLACVSDSGGTSATTVAVYNGSAWIDLEDGGTLA